MKMRDKLISFPVEVLEVLQKYKDKTGVNASDYIRESVARRMVIDGLVWFERVRILDDGYKIDKKRLDLEEDKANQANSFCDREKCEVPIKY